MKIMNSSDEMLRIVLKMKMNKKKKEEVKKGIPVERLCNGFN